MRDLKSVVRYITNTNPQKQGGHFLKEITKNNEKYKCFWAFQFLNLANGMEHFRTLVLVFVSNNSSRSKIIDETHLDLRVDVPLCLKVLLDI